ncbi:MAG: metG [Candidatus Saccharibacteria bacterium]|nr:metG [Candidatus Saccharibacteria bacterium]
MNDYYVTTSIPYVNGEPHIGHALEFIMADVLARSARQKGLNTLYVTGSDEHGLKVAEKAASLDMTPQAFADKVSQQFRELGSQLNITNDRFIRTTDKLHVAGAQKLWKALEKDIYKASYVGWYDVRQEEFVPENRADPERMNPDHPQAYRKLEEENYFFALSKYTAPIRQAIESGEFQVIPESRRNEVLSVLREGLEDISISRPKEKLEWGIPVPGDHSQVMYVWFEALMNYLTVLEYPDGEDFKQYWPASTQVIGKDILRFHAAIWPGMLMGLGLPLPKTLYVHGFINSGGEKMSKSIGNVVAPSEIIETYGTDAFRYYFLRHIPSYDDGDFTWERFKAAYNNELANELGNAVQRTMAMILKYQNGLIGDLPANSHDRAPYDEALKLCKFDRALDHVWDQVRGVNQYIDEEKPWMLAKEDDPEHLRSVLSYTVSSLLEIAELLVPFLPDTAEKIQAIFVEGIIRPSETTLFPKLED